MLYIFRYRTEGHQRLKRYLHPTCGLCEKEFPSRMEWIEHRLTPEHLRKLADSLKDRCGGASKFFRFVVNFVFIIHIKF